MCGRFAVTTDPARLAREIDAVDETGSGSGVPVAPNYNVAPTTDVAAVVARHDEPGDRRAGAERPGIGTEPTRRVRLMRWGLLPAWVKSGPDGRPITKSQFINARADTVVSSPAFRVAAQHKRCLIPMDGYYEWMPAGKSPADHPKAHKTPFYLHRADGRPLMVAGLWSVWRPGRGSAARAEAGVDEPILTCTIITTDAVDQLGRIHDRMPLPVSEADWDRWLDPDLPAPPALLRTPPDISGIVMREVSTLVNNVANNGPELIQPAECGNQPVGLF
jgi:putative SOS response-associated peptidase YedK